MHKHQCTKCGAVWEHSDAIFFAPAEIRDQLHTCPACGTGDQNKKYHDDRPVTCSHGEIAQAENYPVTTSDY